MDVCEEARIRGNDACVREEWDVAISAYGAGISVRASAGKSPDFRLFSNRAAAYVSKYMAVREAGLDLRGLLALAVTDAETATCLRPTAPKAWYRLVVAHVIDGNKAAALFALKQGLSHCPQDSDLQKATAYLDVADFSHIDVALKNFSPCSGDYERRLADVALRSSDFNSAIRWYTRSIDLALRAGIQPDRRAYCNRSAAWLHMASCTDSEEAFTAAVADADRCIAIDDSWPKAWFRKGSAFLEDGRPGSAKDTFEQGLIRCPMDGELRAGLNDSIQVLEKLGPEPDWEELSNTRCSPEYEENHYRFSSDLCGSTFSEEPLLRCTEKFLHRTSVADIRSESGSSSAAESASFGPNYREENHFRYPPSYSDLQRVEVLHGPNIEPASSNSGRSHGPPTHGVDDLQPAARRLKSAPVVTSSTAPECKSDPSACTRRILSLRTENELANGAVGSRNGCSNGAMKNSWPQFSTQPKPITLYDLLGVVQTADENEIKRAYYALARRLHPDKNQCDPEATKKFQQLVDAYRILSNSKSRALYDKYGKYELARNGLGSVDPSTLFAMVFGSDHFGHLIGELQVASLANSVDDNGNAPSSDVLDRIQKDRVGKLAIHLIRMVEPWVTGRHIEFMDWTMNETRRLSSANFGTQLLHVVGRAYCACSTFSKTVGSSRRGVRALPAAISSVFADGVYRTQRARAQLRASAAANRVLAKQRRAHDRVLRLGRGGKSLTAAQSERMAIEMAECAVDMMWKLAVVDIETTVADVVAAVLSCKDISTSDETIMQSRATAILVLGRAFISARP